MQNLTQTVTAAAGQRATAVLVESDILSTNAESVRTRLLDALQRPNAAADAIFELDLRAARMIDSVGLNLLVWLIKKVQERGGRVRLLIADNNIERTLQFTRLSQHAEVVRYDGGSRAT